MGSDETTDTTQPGTETPAAPASTEAPAEAGTAAPTETPEELTGPQLNESLRQMNAQMAELTQRLPEREPEPDPLAQLLEEPEYEDEPQQQQPQADELGDPDLVEEFNRLVDERMRATIAPIFQRQEEQQRAVAIRGLAEKYPDLREHAGEIAQRLDLLAERYGNPNLRTDPALVEDTYLSLKARAAAPGQQGETPAAEAAGREGAVLEQGASPGEPEPEIDPLQQAYDQVFVGSTPEERDVFTGGARRR